MRRPWRFSHYKTNINKARTNIDINSKKHPTFQTNFTVPGFHAERLVIDTTTDNTDFVTSRSNMSAVPQFPPLHIIPDDEPAQNSSREGNEEAQLPHETLALPAPQTEAEKEAAKKLEVGAEALKLDHLGPMVVNSDGTLSRIHNWADMTPLERERTIKILGKRNKLRTESLLAQGIKPGTIGN